MGTCCPFEPGVSFAAHEERDGLVIDNMEGSEPAFLAPHGCFHRPGSATYVLRVGDWGDVGLWVLSPGTVVTRPWPAGGSISEHVEPKWRCQVHKRRNVLEHL